MTIQPKKTVLLIESDRHQRKSLLDILARMGCYILCAAEPQEAFRAIEGPVDIVILDGEFMGIDINAFQSQLRLSNPGARLLVNTAEPLRFTGHPDVEVFAKPREEKALEAALQGCH